MGHTVYRNLICQFHGKIQDGGPKQDSIYTVTEIVEIENGAKTRFGKQSGEFSVKIDEC